MIDQIQTMILDLKHNNPLVTIAVAVVLTPIFTTAIIGAIVAFFGLLFGPALLEDKLTSAPEPIAKKYIPVTKEQLQAKFPKHSEIQIARLLTQYHLNKMVIQ